MCGRGKWSCMHINVLCTSKCFFCIQNRKIKKEGSPKANEIVFDDPEDYVDYLEKFNFKGVGFSGGESMLVFEKMLFYIKKIRQKLGKEIYIWIYTNGDLVNADKLKSLKRAGLDEIRFNISARNYDLRPIELATNIINAVAVEIPAIPEDYEILKRCVFKMQKIGVNYLNIHQLIASKHNCRNFIDRNYTFVHTNFGLSVLESEMTALKLIKYILDNGIKLPVNYCSSTYKYRFQGRGRRIRLIRYAQEKFEEKTNAGYIRRLSIKDSPANIKQIIKNLEGNRYLEELWSLNKNPTEFSIHPTLLRYLDFRKHNLIISYYNPNIKAKINSHDNCKEIKLNPKKSLFIKRTLIKREEFGPKVFDIFGKVFIEKTSSDDLLKYFSKKYNLNSEGIKEFKKDIKNIKREATLEQLETGFPEIY
jgi:pyruvate formate-lyase activating enzyme-like uncharacterized protein